MEHLLKVATDVLAVAYGVTKPVPSPCTSICKMNSKTGLCEGCYRTIDEIVVWSRLADEGEGGKRSIWVKIQQRANLASRESL